jgi:phospholipid N-methyltransferase
VIKRIAFFKEAVKNIKTSGSIMPSSRFLIKKMLHNIDFSKDLILVEFGPANGIITTEIIKRMSKNSKLICFEINPVFYKELKESIKDKRVIILDKSAENIKDELNKININDIDFCVSSLPLAMIPQPICSNIINNTLNVLKTNGGFVQYQYSLHYYKHLKKTFNKQNIRLKFCLMNFPPAFVYNCKKN